MWHLEQLYLRNYLLATFLINKPIKAPTITVAIEPTAGETKANKAMRIRATINPTIPPTIKLKHPPNDLLPSKPPPITNTIYNIIPATSSSYPATKDVHIPPITPPIIPPSTMLKIVKNSRFLFSLAALSAAAFALSAASSSSRAFRAFSSSIAVSALTRKSFASSCPCAAAFPNHSAAFA